MTDAQSDARRAFVDRLNAHCELGEKFQPGTRVRKIKGASWQGRIVGLYSTTLTPVGFAVESEREPGSVQIYPASALEPIDD